MYIAICDDEKKEILYIESLIKKYDLRIEIGKFFSAEELIIHLERQPIDIVFLDIEMKGMNGFVAAKKLVSKGNPPLIVFVTNSSEYTYSGYEVAFRYLSKPVDYKILAKVLTAAIYKVSTQKINITENGRSHILLISDITYFEVYGHQLTVHTKKGTYSCRMKLSEAENLLPDYSFAKPHKSFLVNLNAVSKVDEKELVLINNTRIPMSRRRKQEFEQLLFQFVRRYG